MTEKHLYNAQMVEDTNEQRNQDYANAQLDALRELNSRKLEYIETLYEVLDSHDDAVEFDADLPCSIDFDDFEIGDTAETIYRRATKYSCCGDELDDDYMICPSCGEHC
jgi:hypothetical protein